MDLKESKRPPVGVVDLSFSFKVFCTWRLIHLKLDQVSSSIYARSCLQVLATATFPMTMTEPA